MQGSVVSPSDEDSQTLKVNSAKGEIYRLRGASDYPDFSQTIPRSKHFVFYTLVNVIYIQCHLCIGQPEYWQVILVLMFLH